MKNTTNYNLKLPEGPDKYNISDFNENTEKIDGELKKHADAIADRYNKTEVDNKFSMHEMNVDWKESVDTFDDIATTYPEAENGWTVNVKDTNYTYRYDGTAWVAISANAIPKATEDIDGIMSKELVKEHTKLCNEFPFVATGQDIPIQQRKNRHFYFKITNRQETVTGENIKVSPQMGIKVV